MSTNDYSFKKNAMKFEENSNGIWLYPITSRSYQSFSEKIGIRFIIFFASKLALEINILTAKYSS